MNDHVHDWYSVPGQCGQYTCACSATGYRSFNGDIRAHRTPRVRASTVTVRPYLPDGGRIPPKPRDRS